ncbi:ribosomal RNA large subunit methyltransferase J [Verruconis gallopava]|uniref:Ribosomal RNA large subunit methyltransferase J n=1 Tax=Verruconis gallopava TaxID=253628 RepID=A0A0D1XM46_9PEZI|nr:ribosomal RNA large subunit methyltransferase J [Verruconis gallopava]KIW03481.1 ribosomal RNA large subunit methyltransferase J [Verruconis gallopava]
MAIQKKHGKGRLDKWYKLAKEKGYRARASFKLIQLNKKYHFLEKSKVLIDLCAAPGSWCQVAAEVMPPNSLIIGVDLAPIKPIPRTITFQADITTDKCRTTLRQHLKTWKADTVLHDGAPNVGTAWVQDAYSQAELVLQSLKLATEFLIEGGTFVTKVFRSKDYNPLLWVFNQLFTRVEATKPPSSRNVSAEIFVVCRGYKAPKKIDPKFLDPRSVFAELAEPAPNNEAKVFNPEKKKRKRQGYEEGDWTQFKEVPASEFIQTTDPIDMLGTVNKLSFEQQGNGDLALATLSRLPQTTPEIKECCADLKVLGRKEFRMLLKWRLQVREIFGLSQKKEAHKKPELREQKKDDEEEEVAEVESMDEELKIQEDLQRIQEKESRAKRKERKKNNERKQKELVRMQMGMEAPMDIGLEASGPQGEDALFALKTVEKAGVTAQLAKGKMYTVVHDEKPEEKEEIEIGSDEDGDDLERQLDAMYEEYVERKAARDAKYRAKRARTEHEDGEWYGFEENQDDESSDDDVVEDEDSDVSSDEDEGPSKPLISKLESESSSNGALTRRAQMFFDQEIFKNIDGLDVPEEDDDSGIELQDDSDELKDGAAVNEKVEKESDGDESEDEMEAESDSDFEVVPNAPPEEADSDDDWDDEPRSKTKASDKPNIDIITAEAMTLAHNLATKKVSKHDLLDDGFNKYSHRDVDGLPEWFLDDEAKHSKIQKPITKEAAEAIKAKLRALNARPIKKVAEAKARKKLKAAQRLEKLRKKSSLLMEDEALSEGDKARTVQKMLAKAARAGKKPKRKVSVVVAGGHNKGIKGRPRGTKGKYKMVDARLKKDVRAQKRLKKMKR